MPMTESTATCTSRINSSALPLPANLLDRLRTASSYAAEVYLQHPRYIELLARAGREDDIELQQQIEAVF